MKNPASVFTFVTVIIGFMAAVLYHSTGESEVRDTRTVMELRQELTAEKERQQELEEEVLRHEHILSELTGGSDPEAVMEEAMMDLREKAGLTDVSGPGIIVELKPYFSEGYDGGAIRTVPSELVRMLINELNIYGAKDIAVGSQRIVSTTPVREIQGMTHVNSRRIASFPLQVRVLTDRPDQLYHYMMTSAVREFLQYENFEMTVTQVSELTLPGYDQTMRVRYMQPVKEES
ncbi:DUF881 domain-containing protein [Alteribacter natronophilus]|uniref:DUF881 domain-containing protein n=1 Tax=Alteribacter natronophilus TaxID=2583810 RepID=UPI00110EE7AA|nr:DUF881 domain-containing protein [Alteribacter natronophilus]TMW73129.1 DUF881 domain-containing protein [Alteribacter natronophilus]